jgi:hypothetical protein
MDSDFGLSMIRGFRACLLHNLLCFNIHGQPHGPWLILRTTERVNNNINNLQIR